MKDFKEGVKEAAVCNFEVGGYARFEAVMEEPETFIIARIENAFLYNSEDDCFVRKCCRHATHNEIQEYRSKTKATEEQSYDYINPDHYKSFSMEVIDMMVAIWGKEKVADHCEITAFKYKMRLGSKPDQPTERDLEKANWYLKKSNELREGNK